MYLIADTDLSSWFMQAIEEDVYGKTAFAPGKLSVTLLNAALLCPHCIFEVKPPFDPIVSLEALFLDKTLVL